MSDLKSQPDFQPDLMPQCDNTDEPAGRSAALKSALAEAYYHLNVATEKRRRLREGGDLDPGRERELLQEIERALLVTEDKEDELARAGLCATPTLRSGVVVNLAFCEPGREGPAVRIASRSSSVSFNYVMPWDEN